MNSQVHGPPQQNRDITHHRSLLLQSASIANVQPSDSIEAISCPLLEKAEDQKTDLSQWGISKRKDLLQYL